MNVEIVELEENFEKTNFCGFSLYQPQPPRNAKLAPKRFVENAKGFFEEHTQEEKEILMKNYCEQIQTEKVIAYCHYCVRGLRLGGKKKLFILRTFIFKKFFQPSGYFFCYNLGEVKNYESKYYRRVCNKIIFAVDFFFNYALSRKIKI